MYEVLWDGASLGLGKVWLSDRASAATAIVGLAVQCADFDMAYQTGVQRFWLHISYHGKIEHMTWGDRVFAAICHVLQYLLDGQDVVIHCVHGILRKCRCKRHGLDGIPRPHMLVLMLDTSVCLHQYGGIVSISLMGMRHLIHVRCMPCFPGRHRSGFFAILLLMVLSEVHGRWSWIQLNSAKETYFACHPEFEKGDHNESRVESLIEKNLQGHNIHEFDDLGAAVVHTEVYERFKAKQADRTASQQLSARASSASSSPPPWRRRGRSRVRSPRSEVDRSRSPVRLRPRPKVKSKARPKPKVHPEPKPRPKSKARPTQKRLCCGQDPNLCLRVHPGPGPRSQAMLMMRWSSRMIGCRGIVGLARPVGPSTCVSHSGVHVGLRETFGKYWAVTIGHALSAATSTLHGERCVHGPHALARIGVAFVAMSISLVASSAIAAIVRSPAPGSNNDSNCFGS